MTDEVKAMIEETVRELKGSGRWLVASARKKREQLPPQGPSTPLGMTNPRLDPSTPLPCARDDNSIVEAAEAGNAEKAIAAGYQELKRQVQAELLARIKAGSAKFFEKLVVELMVRLGYGGALENPGTVTGQSGDAGIDGVIKEDRLGLKLIYIQAKRWNHDVSRDEIHKFVGALHGKKASRGIFATTSSFTKSALEYAAGLEGKRVILIDGEKLTELMFETGLGLVAAGTYHFKKVDSDYFKSTHSTAEDAEGAEGIM